MKAKITFIVMVVFLITTSICKGQNSVPAADSTRVKPTFNGKDATETFPEWVSSRCVYPEEARIKGIQGTVEIHLSIEKDGSITNVSATNSRTANVRSTTIKSIDTLLAEEVVRVVKTSPKWEPGSKDGKPEQVGFLFIVGYLLFILSQHK